MEQKTAEFEELIKEKYRNIAGIVVMKDGEKRYEAYFNDFSENDSAHVFSVTKSVISMLFGIAVGQGKILGMEQKVLDFFPGYVPKRGEKLARQVTLGDMLSMTTPFKYKHAPYTKYFTSDDWVKTALDLMGGRGKIGEFRYMPLIGPDIMSGILENAVGMHPVDFANEFLFAPLGIAPKKSFVFETKEEQFAWYKNVKHDGEWISDPMGRNTAGWGLCLTANEMAKLGNLYLENGSLEGKSLIPESWISESTKIHSRWEEENLDFGYLWWVIDENSFAAIGDGGNVIYVNRKKNLVVSILSLFKPMVFDRIDFIKEKIEPLFG